MWDLNHIGRFQKLTTFLHQDRGLAFSFGSNGKEGSLCTGSISSQGEWPAQWTLAALPASSSLIPATAPRFSLENLPSPTFIPCSVGGADPLPNCLLGMGGGKDMTQDWPVCLPHPPGYSG